MTPNHAKIITDYRERCARLLQGSAPDSAEYIAYSRILQAFDENQIGEPDFRSIKAVALLVSQANNMNVHPLAPPELKERMAKAHKIVTKWRKDFQRDAGHTGEELSFP